MRRHIPWAAALVAVAAVTATTPSANAQDNECRMHAPLSSTRLLRRSSLALLGRVPTLDEYAQVRDIAPESDAYNAVIDSWFESDEYRVQMRRYHMQLLWANPDGVSLRDNTHLLNSISDGNGGVLWRLGSVTIKRTYRGGDGTHDCQNVPQTSLQPGYQPGDYPTCQPAGSDGVGAFCQEGYVNINPYWDPSSTIKVCAFDAQAALTYQKPNTPNPGEYSCNDWQAKLTDIDPAPGTQRNDACGCGPDLMFCMASGSGINLDPIITGAMREQLLRVVDDYTRGQAPYSELLTTKKAYLNGPLTHFFKYLAPMASPGRTHNVVYNDVPLQDKAFTDNNWYEVERGDLHAGILTLPAYLLRFQTNRGRANRFRIAFMGQYFVPSETASEGCSTDSEDVTEKCYCDSCHQTLEPMSMYFGSFAEAGSASLFSLKKQIVDDPNVSGQQEFNECRDQWLPVGNSWCNRFYRQIYIDDPNNPGQTVSTRTINPLEYGAAHEEYETNYDAGPAGMLSDHAMKPLSGKEYSFFAWATVRNLFQFLIGREIDLDPLSPDNEQQLLDALATNFEANGFDFRLLAKDIVSLPTFRRMP